MDVECWAIGNWFIALTFVLIGFTFGFPRWAIIFLLFFGALFGLGLFFDLPR